MLFEDLWGPLSTMLRVLHTGGANQEHFDLHHHGANPGAICTSICTNSGANPGAICTPIYINLMQENASIKNLRGLHWGFEGVKLTLLRGLDVIDLRWLESIELRGWILARQIAPSQFLPRGSFLARLMPWVQSRLNISSEPHNKAPFCGNYQGWD